VRWWDRHSLATQKPIAMAACLVPFFAGLGLGLGEPAVHPKPAAGHERYFAKVGYAAA
jgi:hypothetical protein